MDLAIEGTARAIYHAFPGSLPDIAVVRRCWEKVGSPGDFMIFASGVTKELLHLHPELQPTDFTFIHPKPHSED